MVWDRSEDASDEGRQTDDWTHHGITRALVRPPILLHAVFLIREHDRNAVGPVEGQRVVTQDLVSPIAKGDPIELNDLSSSRRGGCRELARPHRKEIAHDCELRDDSRWEILGR